MDRAPAQGRGGSGNPSGESRAGTCPGRRRALVTAGEGRGRRVPGTRRPESLWNRGFPLGEAGKRAVTRSRVPRPWPGAGADRTGRRTGRGRSAGGTGGDAEHGGTGAGRTRHRRACGPHRPEVDQSRCGGEAALDLTWRPLFPSLSFPFLARNRVLPRVSAPRSTRFPGPPAAVGLRPDRRRRPRPAVRAPPRPRHAAVGGVPDHGRTIREDGAVECPNPVTR
jgi:hypothetical protein